MTGPPADPELQREVATAVVRRLRDAGHEAFFVGGCVREMLLGATPADYDVTTALEPDGIAELFPHTVPVGARFGVMTVIERGVHVEVATFRTEGGYADGRRPQHVSFATAEEDVARRDLTINALLYDPVADEVIDHVGGRRDLEDGLIRTVGDPAERFAEDHLRLLRAVRFAARLDFRIDPDAEAAMRRLADRSGRVSPERLRDELTRMLAHPSRGRALRLLDDLGLSDHALPELASMTGASRERAIAGVEALDDSATVEVAWATFLRELPDVDGLLRRLRLSNAQRASILELVRRHDAVRRAAELSRPELRRLLAAPELDALTEVARADSVARGDDSSWLDRLADARRQHPGPLPEPLLTGGDVTALGIPAGPIIGMLLDRVRDEQLDGQLATRDQALARLRQLGESAGDLTDD